MCTRALDELLLELGPSMRPELEEEEEEVVEVVWDTKEADGLLRFRENGRTIEEEDDPITRCRGECS